MKLSKKSVESMLKCEVAVLLPRIRMPVSKPQNGLFKRKKSKRGRSSGGSDKENNNARNVIPNSQPNLNLIQIEKALEVDHQGEHSKRLKLSENDRKLLLATFSNRSETTTYSRFHSFKIKCSETVSRKIVSQSQSVNLPHVIMSDEETNCNINNSQIKKTSVKGKYHQKKGKKGKCFRKDSGIGMESPKKNKSMKRKISDLMDDASDEVQVIEDKDNAATLLDSPESEICDLKAIIESHSSHRFTDEINRKINNIEANGLFICNDFVIRITQCCYNKPSGDNVAEHTTSLVTSTTRCENIKKSSKQECKNIVVEKKIGLNKRMKMNGKEKTCTQIVESKYVQTSEQKRKKIWSNEPSRMVTRHKAALNTECEFVALTNKQGFTILKNQANRLNQNKEESANFKKKLNVVYNTRIKNHMKTRNLDNSEEKSELSVNKSFCRSKNFEAIMLNSNKTKIRRIFKNITLYRKQNSEPSGSHVKQNIENTTKKQNSLTSKDNGNKDSENADEELRKSTRIRKHLNYKEIDDEDIRDENHDEDDEDCSIKKKPIIRRNIKQSKNNCGAENAGISGVIVLKEKQLDFEVPVKQKLSKSVKNVKNNAIEAHKKSSKTPVKRLMKKSEALEKTEKFNEQKKQNLRNNGRTTRTKTVSLNNAALPRRSPRTRNNDLVANTNKGTPFVTFSSKTPGTIPRPDNEERNNINSNFTPRILIDRLDATDISTYAITPLREDRGPLPSKSYEDYGIDDVNTDDSTDDEDCPKKVVPKWVQSVGHQSIVQFYFPRDTIRNWIRPPTTKFTVNSLFS